MADIRINSLPTTASASSSDDFLALDGATNGTRKLNAYSPTFGGNLTVSGTSALSGAVKMGSGSAVALGAQAVVVDAGSEMRLQLNSTDRPGIYFTAAGSNLATMRVNSTAFELLTTSGTPISISQSTLATTLSGNLTVSGTGGISIGSATFTGGRALTATTGSGNSVSARLLQTGVADWEIKNVATTGRLAFQQSSTDYLQLTATGNLLLGTTTDDVGKLQVNGSVTAYTGAKAVSGSSSLVLKSTDASALSGALTLYTNATGSSRYLKLEAFEQGFGGRSLVLQENGGSVLIATNVDSGNGKLQLATHTTSAGGIGFGTDVNLFRNTTSQLRFSSGSSYGVFQIQGASGSYVDFYATDGTTRNGSIGTEQAGTMYVGTRVAASTIFLTNGTTALTLDSSQNATFAGNITVDKATPTILVKRSANTQDGVIAFATGGSGDFSVGNRGTSDSDLHIYNYGLAADAVTISKNTSNATFAGTVTANNVITATTANDYGLTGIRTSSATNATARAALIQHTTSGDMVDGQGAAVAFAIRDSAAVTNIVGDITCVRAGADNTGDIVFRPYTTGTANERMRVRANGRINFASLPTSSAGLAAGDIWNDGGTLKIV